MGIDFIQYIEQQHPRTVLLVHHWDTDGLASAALILKYAQEHRWTTRFELMHPQINNYFLTEKELQQIRAQKLGAIVTVDLNFPLSTIEALESVGVPVFVFDHHTQTAKINRPGVQDVSYPGCSMLVSDYLLQPLSLTAVLGMVGDQEDRIAQYVAFYPAVEQMMKDSGLSLQEMLRITKRIDTSYVLSDTQAMHHAIDVLRNDPKTVLTDDTFLRNERTVVSELERVLTQEPESPRARVRTLHIESTASVISEVTRALSKRFPDDVIITDQAYVDFSNIYVRRRNAAVDVSYIATEARNRGYNSGGKAEVTGIILPKEQLDAMRQWIIESLPL